MKINKTICDKCGTEIKQAEDRPIIFGIGSELFNNVIHKEYQFCDECTEEIFEIIEKWILDQLKVEGIQK